MDYHILVKPLGVELRYGDHDTLLDALRDAGIGVESVCGGLGTCGKCRVQVLAGKTNAPTAEELDRLPGELLERGMRLTCQVRPEGDLSLYIPASSLTREQRLQLDSGLRVEEFAPAVRSCDLEVEMPETPGDPGSDLYRVEKALSAAGCGEGHYRVDIAALRGMPSILREEEGKIRAVARGEELLGFISSRRSPLGLAVDLGSTKVALFVYDLSDGSMLTSRGFLNPQIHYGEDIITRIQQAMEGRASRLQELVVKEMNVNLSRMLAEVGRSMDDVFEMILVGNTAMHHLFLALPVAQLGKSPYLPATDLPLEVKARDLGLKLNPAAVVYLPPPIAGYVGSDHLAAVIATRLWERLGPCLLLDIGTNTEVALQAEGRIRSCSCASGPAFEGGGLSQGMRAGEGAIEGVTLDPGGRELELSVIGNVPPVGICGSGILSALAALAAAGIVDPGGRLQEGHPGVKRRGGELAFFLSPKGEENGEGVAITQSDIREIQKAKGAMRAGVDALLAEAGVDYRELKEIVMAGAFGSYIDPADALSISLLPPVSVELINQVGNAAGAGARSMLLSTRARAEAEELAARIDYLELSAYPPLSLLFAADMYLSEEAVEAAKRRSKI